MIGGCFRECGGLEQVCTLDAVGWCETGNLETPGGEGAGLVHHDGIDIRRGFKVFGPLDHDTETGCSGKRGDHRGGRGEQQCGRAGHNEHGDRTQCSGFADGFDIALRCQEEDDEGHREGDGDIEPGDLLDEELALGLGGLGFTDEARDLADGGVFADLRDFDIDRACEV